MHAALRRQQLAPHDDLGGLPGTNQLDLKAFGHAIWVANHDDGHSCSTDHRYTEYYTMVNTEQLQLKVYDDGPGDNHGVLTVTISRG